MNTRKRIPYLDYAKGILIIAVVLGHVMPESDIIHSWIYSWHMPAFFFLNGVLLSYTEYEKKNFFGREGILWKGIKNLMIPYYMYGSLLMFVRWIDSGFELYNLKWQIIDLFSLWGIGATWFLPCLFFAQLIYWGIRKSIFSFVFSDIKVKYFIFGVLTLVLMVVPFKVKTDSVIIKVLFRSIIGATFIISGNVFLVGIKKIEKNKNVLAIAIGSIISLFISCILFVFTGKLQVSLNVLNLSSLIVYISNAMIGIIWVILVAKVSEQKSLFLSKILDFYGKSSLTIMGTHQIIMLLFRIPIRENYWWDFIYCVGILIAEIPVIITINRVKCRRKRK